MADRKLTVRIIGDAKSLEQAFTRATRSSQKFNAQVGKSTVEAVLKRQVSAVNKVAAAEERLIKIRSRRASSIGAFRFAGVGLGAATGLFAATQAVRELGDRLETTGAAAFKTEGRLKNMVSALTSGNLVGAFAALKAQPQTLEDLGFAAALGRDQIAALQQVATGTTTELHKLGAATFALGVETQSLSAIEDKAGTSSQKLARQYLAQRDAVALTELATSVLADSVARLGQQFLTQSGAVVTFKGAVDDLARAGRGEPVFGNVPGEPRPGRPSIPPLSPSQRRELDLIGQEGTARISGLNDRLRQLNNQIKAGNINQEQRLTILTNIKQTEAEIAGIYKDQAAARAADAARAKAAAEAAARDLAAKLKAAKAARLEAIAAERERRNAKQFFALGLSPTGGERTPNIKGLRRQLGNFEDAVKGSFLDTKKTRSVMSTIRKLLGGGMGKLSEDVRSTIRDMLRDLNQQLKNAASGPLTKTSGLDTKKIIAGLGLSPEQAGQIRGRLSGFNSAGRAIGGRPIVVESHTTVQLDGHIVGQIISRNQQKTTRRNPPQRRGPNAGRTP